MDTPPGSPGKDNTSVSAEENVVICGDIIRGILGSKGPHSMPSSEVELAG